MTHINFETLIVYAKFRLAIKIIDTLLRINPIDLKPEKQEDFANDIHTTNRLKEILKPF